MKLNPNSTFSQDALQEITADPFRSFVQNHREGLWHAARLLGGYEAARLVDRCTDLLANDRRLTPQIRIMGGQILSVLKLEKLDDRDAPYMGFFAVIDASDPVVEDICLLTDGLQEAIERAWS